MNLKSILTPALLLAAAAAGAQSTTHFGYVADNPSLEDLSSQGTNKNLWLECAVGFDPATVPYFASLKGAKITGVRCYLRCDYKQKAQGRTTINLYAGELSDSPLLSKTTNFLEGWNEVLFDEPYEITDPELPIFVGYRVFELMGPQSLPLVSYSPSGVTGSYYANPGRTGWVDNSDRGSLLVQAIVELPEGSDPMAAPGAVAQISGAPRIVAPEAPFAANLYVHNFSSSPIESFTLTTTNPDRTYDFTPAEPIAPYGSTLIPTEIYTSDEEGTDVKITACVSAINGSEVTPAATTQTTLYVSKDNFLRVPLIEEYTSQKCVNCPFMAYYLEKARENVGLPHIFVAHHSGYAYDSFTQQVDKELEYLFFGEPSNPQATYDRTILPGKKSLMNGAYVAEWEPYAELITEAYNLPAFATINVSHTTADDGQISVSVNGRVAQGDVSADGLVYLSTYVVEDKISRDGYPQIGVDANVDPTAPGDLAATYRHNGVIRRNLSTVELGDKLDFDADGNFAVTYEPFAPDAKWNPDNTHIVAFIHRINKEVPADNYVLNAADSPTLSGKNSAIPSVEAGPEALRWIVDANGRLTVTTAIHSARLFTTAGRELPLSARLTPGIYILRAILPSGAVRSERILVR